MIAIALFGLVFFLLLLLQLLTIFVSTPKFSCFYSSSCPIPVEWGAEGRERAAVQHLVQYCNEPTAQLEHTVETHLLLLVAAVM